MAAAQPAGTPPLTADSLGNATYLSSPSGMRDTLGGRTVQLTDGNYPSDSLPEAPTFDAEGMTVTLHLHNGDLSATGDLDGDGAEDIATIFVEGKSGVNNLTWVLEVYLNQNGQPVPAASLNVGDRTSAITSLSIQSGLVTLTELRVGGNDAMCCPSQPYTQVLSLQDGQLVDVSAPTAAPTSTTALAAWTDRGYRSGCAPVPVSGNPEIFIASVSRSCPATDHERLYWLLRGLGNPGTGTQYQTVADEMRDDQAAEFQVLTSMHPANGWPELWNRATAVAHDLQNSYQGHHWQFLGETPVPVDPAACVPGNTVAAFRPGACWGA